MKIDGIGGRRKKSERMKASHDVVKLVSGGRIDIKKKVVRGKRGKYNTPEADLRRDVIKELRKKSCVVKRIENGITRSLGDGIPDLWVFSTRKRMAGWVELKAWNNDLQPPQIMFQEYCKMCSQNHWVVRSVEEALEIFT